MNKISNELLLEVKLTLNMLPEFKDILEKLQMQENPFAKFTEEELIHTS